jgi:DNA-binding SARP family transcriptional activator
LTDDGRQLPLPTRKDRLLLAYLGLSPGRAHPRERLAGLLWSDRAAAQARDSLKQSLASIRQTFRQVGLDPLCADRDSAALEADRIEIDAIEFARFAASSKQPERAAALYQGELLEGIDGLGSDLDTWLRAERERLTDLASACWRSWRLAPITMAQLRTRSGSAAFCSHATRFGSRFIVPSCASWFAKTSAQRP